MKSTVCLRNELSSNCFFLSLTRGPSPFSATKMAPAEIDRRQKRLAPNFSSSLSSSRLSIQGRQYSDNGIEIKDGKERRGHVVLMMTNDNDVSD